MLDKEIEAFNLQYAALDKACRAGVFGLAEAHRIQDASQVVADLIESGPDGLVSRFASNMSLTQPAIAAPPLPQTVDSSLITDSKSKK